MKKTFSLFLAFALGVVVPQTFAADYYVSPTGDDKAAGTSAETRKAPEQLSAFHPD